MAYTLALDDLILDGLVAKIARHRDADALVDRALSYDIERDRISAWQDLSRPLVVAELESDTPDGRDYVARYRLLCLVPTKDDDATAVARLSIIKEQIRLALLDKDDHDLGLSVGSIGKIARPTWARVAIDDDETDVSVLAGSWSLEITYEYIPQDISGPTLEAISIDLGRFAALYTLGGQS